MTSLLVLLAAVAGAQPVAPARVASPLDGCDAEHEQGGWTYKCGDLLVSIVEDEGATESPQELFAQVIEDIAREFGSIERRTEQWRVNGQPAEVIILNRDGRTCVVTVLARREGLEAVICVQDGDAAACKPVIDDLAMQPWGKQVIGTRRVGPPSQAPDGEP